MGNATSSIKLSKFKLKNITVFADRESTIREIPETEFTEISDSNIFCVPDVDGGIVGLRLWPGALRLAAYLEELYFASIEISKKASVLELGCGVGLPGLTLAKLGMHVTLTDRESGRIPVEEAIRANGVDAVFETFDWGSGKDLARFSANKFDLVIASEVIYSEEMAPLLNALLAVSSGNTPLIIIQYTTRSSEDEKYFLEKILAHFNIVEQRGIFIHLVRKYFICFAFIHIYS